MKIGVIGTGNVGSTLGTRWATKGHDVIFGTREPGSPRIRSLVKLTDNRARAASVHDAASGSDVVVLATPWSATRDAVAVAGDLHGKIVVDCTNPIAPGFTLAVGHTTSGGEQVAAWAKGARVVKAFNTTGANNMADTAYGDRRATMLVCGDDKHANEVVVGLAEDLGFECYIAGGLAAARLLEPLAMLWIQLAHAGGLGREFSLSILRR